MQKRKRINKLKISIVIIFIVCTLTTVVFGRFIYNNIREAYFTAKQFYFTSDILTANGANYLYTNWGGYDVYPIEFELRSYNNSLTKLDYDLEYTVSCETSDTDKIRCTINSYDDNATNTATGTIYATTNFSKIVVFVKPLVKIERSDTVKVRVIAKTEAPYHKEISCEFSLKPETIGENTYSIEDSANSEYALLKLVNVSEAGMDVTLEFDPKELRLDLNDEIYKNKISMETTTISGSEYVKKIVFHMEKEFTRNVKFYKVDKSQNYTYPGVNDTSKIKVTI